MVAFLCSTRHFERKYPNSKIRAQSQSTVLAIKGQQQFLLICHVTYQCVRLCVKFLFRYFKRQYKCLNYTLWLCVCVCMYVCYHLYVVLNLKVYKSKIEPQSSCYAIFQLQRDKKGDTTKCRGEGGYNMKWGWFQPILMLPWK